jgi:hypothetical protein
MTKTWRAYPRDTSWSTDRYGRKERVPYTTIKADNYRIEGNAVVFYDDDDPGNDVIIPLDNIRLIKPIG